MKVTHVEVNGFGKLQSASWIIDPEQKTIIICGDHGTGKSTFLRAIKHCLHSNLVLNRSTLTMGEGFEYSIQVRLLPTCDADHILLEGVESLKAPAYPNLNNKREAAYGKLVPFCYISSQYAVPMHPTQCGYYLRDFSRSLDLISANFSYPGPVTDPLAIVAAYLKTLESEDRVNALVSLNSALSSIVNLQIVLIDDFLVKCIRLDGVPLDDFDFLSDAEYYALAVLTVTLLCLPQSGVLLLDTPEMFLHPRAFEALISHVTNHLTYGQLIVASHSPSTLATLTPAVVYVLEYNALTQTPARLDRLKTLRIVESLYGEEVKDLLVAALSRESTTEVLTYLMECAFSPQATIRHSGDPQIQQLAMWIQGAVTGIRGLERLAVVDVGAGAGDFIASVCASGCANRLSYLPVEPEVSLWETILQRGENVPGLEVQDPRVNLRDIQRADVVVAINVLHELQPSLLARTLREMLILTTPHGMLLIHEVTVLPVGEADFIVWSSSDLLAILRESGLTVDLVSAKTVTRPGGWPLETTCIRAVLPVPPEDSILNAINRHLMTMLKQWSSRVGSLPPGDMNQCSPERYRAFVLAQTANIACRVYA